MDVIYIPDLLRIANQTKRVEVDGFLPDLETLTPVKGHVLVKHQGSYLEVSTHAETIVTLACDRCLQHYNYRLVTDANELIWLREIPNAEEADLIDQELAMEDLVETLPARGHFKSGEWLYEQLCLEIPPHCLCKQNCKGIQVSEEPKKTETIVDLRWASLQSLRDQLPQ